MADPIGPGDVVECIESHDPDKLTVGGVYCVAVVGSEGRCTCMIAHRPWAFNHAGLLLSDAPPPNSGAYWCSYMFRPLSRKSDFLTTLEEIKAKAHDLTPAPLEPVSA